MIPVYAFALGVILFLAGRICVHLCINVYRHRKGLPQWRIVFLDRRDQDKARVLDFCAQTADGALARFLEKFPDAVPTIVYRWPSDAEVAGELSAPLPGTTI